MVFTLQRVFLVVVMALALLAGLFGLETRMQTAAPVHHSSSIQSTHTLAYYCPPPPYVC